MKKIAVILVVIAVLAGAGLLGANYLAQKKAIESVDKFLANWPEVTESKRGEISYSFWSKKLTVPDLKVKFKKDAPVNLEIQMVEVLSPNWGLLDALRQVAGGQAAEFGDLVKALAISGLKISSNLSNVSAVRLDFTDLKAKPFALNPDSALKVDVVLQNIATVLSSFAAAKIVAEKVETDDGQNAVFSSKTNRIVVTDYQGGRAASVVKEGLDFGDSKKGKDKVRVKIQAIKVKQSDLSKALAISALEPLSPKKIPQILAALSVGEMTAEKMEIVDLESGKVKGGLALYSLESLQGAMIAKISVEGFFASDEQGVEVKIKQFQSNKLDFSKALEKSLLEWPPKEIKDFFTIQGIKFGGVEVAKQKVKMFDLKDFSFSQGDPKGAIFSSAVLSIKGFELDPSAMNDAKAKEIWQGLGYEKLSLNFDLDVNFNQESKLLEIKRLVLNMPKGAEISISVSLDGLDLSAIASQEQALSSLARLRLKNARMGYSDDSLAQRALEYAAKQQGTAAEDLRSLLILQAGEIQKMAPPVYRSLGDGVIAFLKAPNRLVLAAAPPEPIPVMMLKGLADQSPDALLSRLNLSLQINNQPPVKVGP